jgi:hypothetical protein
MEPACVDDAAMRHQARLLSSSGGGGGLLVGWFGIRRKSDKMTAVTPCRSRFGGMTVAAATSFFSWGPFRLLTVAGAAKSRWTSRLGSRAARTVWMCSGTAGRRSWPGDTIIILIWVLESIILGRKRKVRIPRHDPIQKEYVRSPNRKQRCTALFGEVMP